MTYSLKQYMLVESTLTEAMRLLKSSTIVITPNDKGFEHLKSDVLGIKNDNENVAQMIDILGVPKDGSAIRIRTGFMKYDDTSKTLYFAKYKSDLPQQKQA